MGNELELETRVETNVTTLHNSLLDHRLDFASVHNVHVYFRVLNGMPLRHVTHTLSNFSRSRVSNLCCTRVDDLKVRIKLHGICSVVLMTVLKNLWPDLIKLLQVFS